MFIIGIAHISDTSHVDIQLLQSTFTVEFIKYAALITSDLLVCHVVSQPRYHAHSVQLCHICTGSASYQTRSHNFTYMVMYVCNVIEIQ